MKDFWKWYEEKISLTWIELAINYFVAFIILVVIYLIVYGVLLLLDSI